MAIGVTLSTSVVTRDQNGFHVTDLYRVTGYNHPDAVGRSYLAMFATDASSGLRVPQYGEYHPVVPDVQVARITGASPDVEIYEYTIEYGLLPASAQEPSETAPVETEVSTTLQTRRSQFVIDTAGNRVLAYVDYTFAILDDQGNPIGSESTPQRRNGWIEIEVPMTVVRLRRREPLSPGDKSKQYVGTVNATGVFNDPPRYWLCTGIHGTTTDGGLSYDVTYEFQRNPDAWTVLLEYPFTDEDRKPDNGAPTLGNGLALWNVYPETEFRSLML